MPKKGTIDQFSSVFMLCGLNLSFCYLLKGIDLISDGSIKVLTSL